MASNPGLKITIGADVASALAGIQAVNAELSQTGGKASQAFDAAAASATNFNKAALSIASVFNEVAASSSAIKRVGQSIDEAAAKALNAEDAFTRLQDEMQKLKRLGDSKISTANIDAYRKSVLDLKKDLAGGIVPKIAIVSADTLNTRLKDLTTRLSKATEPVVITKLYKEVQKTEAAILALDKSVTAKSGGGSILGKLAPGATQASQALTNLGRVAQDAPFGFIGIQNNINPLIESFGQLQKSAGSTGAALKALGSSFIGAAGIGLAISVVTSLITTAIQKYGSLGNAINVVFGLTTNLEQAQRDLNKAFVDSEASVAGEIATITSLVSIARDKTLSDEARQEALDKLNKEYDKYLPKLTQENINTTQVTDAVGKLTSALIRQAKIRGVQDLISKEAQNQAEAYSKLLDEINDKGNVLTNTFNDFLAGGFTGSGKTKAIIDLGKEFEKSEQKGKVFQGFLNDLLREDAKQGTLFTDGGKEDDQALKKLRLTLQQLKTEFAEIGKIRKAGLITAADEQRAKELKKSIADVTRDIQKREVELGIRAKVTFDDRSLEDAVNGGGADQKLKALKEELQGYQKQLEVTNRLREAGLLPLYRENDALDLQLKILDTLNKIDAREVTTKVKPKLEIDPVLNELEIQKAIAQNIIRSASRSKIEIIVPAKVKIDVPQAVLPDSLIPENAFDKTLEVIQRGKERIMIGLNDLVTPIEQILEQGAENAAAAVGESIGNAIAGVGSAGDILGSFGQVIGDVIIQLGKMLIAAGITIKGLQKALANIVITPVAAIVAGVAAVAVGQAVKAAFNNTRPRRLEYGGILTRPTTVIAGEAGPEAFLPLDKLSSIFGAAGSNTNVNVTGQIRYDGRNFIADVARATNQYNRMNGK